jgi:phosphoribosylglycinamide formyltransferase-1
MASKKTKLAIFASGNGSNAENIVKYFNGSNQIEADSIYANKNTAYVLERAANLGIKSFYYPNKFFRDGDELLNILKEREIDYIILAGFLLKIPENIIDAYPDKILNIHPALLPKYGGKGMYGDNVHKAVKKGGETESGITIHIVNECYDDGMIVFQAKCSISKSDTYEDIANKIHKLEYEHFPTAIERFVLSKKL